MVSVKIQKSLDDQGQITSLQIEGMLVLENSQQLKNEIVAIIGDLSDQLEITISKVDDLDLSCIQLFVAFMKYMDEINMAYQLNWDLDEDQKLLLENAGLSHELFKTNLYA